MLIANARALRGDYPADLREILSIESARQSRDWLSHWSRLAAGGTPLRSLPGLAAKFGIAELAIKDESVRSEIGSFKALGAPFALLCLIRSLWPERSPDAASLFRGGHEETLQALTVVTATDGNHGRALAAAAQSVGCRCVIVLHAKVSPERERAIAAYGAEIVRIEGNYDASVAEAARLAGENGWYVVSDTSYPGYRDVPRNVMQGYGTIAAEIVEQTDSRPERPAFTHVLMQGGVGGLAAGVAGYFWEFHGAHRPAFVVVEPRQADCLWQSAKNGRSSAASGTVDSLMAGLACGDTSPLAWEVLERCVDRFLTIDDDDAVAAMRLLARGSRDDVPIVAGESGAAGLAGLVALIENPQHRREAGLHERSRVLAINTEGATAPDVYRELVRETAAAVLGRQRAWLRKRGLDCR